MKKVSFWEKKSNFKNFNHIKSHPEKNQKFKKNLFNIKKFFLSLRFDF